MWRCSRATPREFSSACSTRPASARRRASPCLSARAISITASFGGRGAGSRYGLRADGPYDLARGHRYDPAKLLVDPYAKLIDRPFRYAPELGAPRGAPIDTAPFMPRAIVTAQTLEPAPRPARTGPPGLIYEVAVKAFSKRHPGIRPALRGTLAALAEPAALEHLAKLGVTHVELMPIAAWMDERHLPPLGLANAWGYNPILFMAPDPRLAPGGVGELRAAVASLHQAGISVILDVVYNHTAEGDAAGPTASLRGLDNAVYFRHVADDPGRLVNDTACGNTLACDRAPVIRLVMDAMRHWVTEAGIDGFRFDLATVLGRTPQGYAPEAPLLTVMRQDPLLRDLVLIAEPWDVGPGGYRLGQFPAPFLEWNDKYRDDTRRFWRGDAGLAGALATRLAGSSDIFQSGFGRPSASVNFVACHDGFTLADLVAFERKHNEANGEENRDGTNDNHSWNNGAEGETEDPAVKARRQRDIRALLATLFLSRGTPMLTAGDELGRSQKGNNNAYAQDNELSFIDWGTADRGLVDFVGKLCGLARSFGDLAARRLLHRNVAGARRARGCRVALGRRQAHAERGLGEGRSLRHVGRADAPGRTGGAPMRRLQSLGRACAFQASRRRRDGLDLHPRERLGQRPQERCEACCRGHGRAKIRHGVRGEYRTDAAGGRRDLRGDRRRHPLPPERPDLSPPAGRAAVVTHGGAQCSFDEQERARSDHGGRLGIHGCLDGLPRLDIGLVGVDDDAPRRVAAGQLELDRPVMRVEDDDELVGSGFARAAARIVGAGAFRRLPEPEPDAGRVPIRPLLVGLVAAARIQPFDVHAVAIACPPQKRAFLPEFRSACAETVSAHAPRRRSRANRSS